MNFAAFSKELTDAEGGRAEHNKWGGPKLMTVRVVGVKDAGCSKWIRDRKCKWVVHKHTTYPRRILENALFYTGFVFPPNWI